MSGWACMFCDAPMPPPNDSAVKCDKCGIEFGWHMIAKVQIERAGGVSHRVVRPLNKAERALQRGVVR